MLYPYHKIVADFPVMERNKARRKPTCKKCIRNRQRIWEKNLREANGLKAIFGRFECVDCKIEKDVNEFRRKENSKRGVSSRCSECWKIKDKRRYEADSERIKNRAKISAIKCGYGLTREEFYSMYAAQDGKCGICRISLSRDILTIGHPHSACIDHNHETGEIRGILCRHCNGALGLFKDRLDVIERAVEYLKGSLL